MHRSISRARVAGAILLGWSAAACDDPAPPAAAPAASATHAEAAPEVEASAKGTSPAPAPPPRSAPSAAPTGDGPTGDGPTGDGPTGDGPTSDGPTGDGPAGAGSALAAAPPTSAEGAPAEGGAAATAPPALARTARTGILKPGEADRILAKGSSSKVRLLDAGAEPRSALRYALAPGEATGIEMGLTMTLELAAGARSVPAQKLPRIATLLELLTAKGTEAGTTSVVAKVRDVSIAKDSGLPQQVADKLLPHLETIEGLELSYLVTPEGRVKQAGARPASGKGGTADTTLAQMTQSLESMIAPFPDEPVGVGARWEVVARFDSSGTELLQWSTFELRSRDEGGAKLGLEVSQAAARADVHPPNLPPGVGAKLVAFTSKGTGESVVELARPAPRAASMRVESEMTIEVDKGGGAEKQETTMKSSMLVDMGRKEQPPAKKAP